MACAATSSASMPASIAPLLLSPWKISLVLGLSFFFGLAFERFYATSERRSRPGGIRTFPLIALSGAFLFALEPHYAIAFCVGLVVLGVWLYPYYAAEVAYEERAPNGGELTSDGLMVPICNLVAYVLGPIGVAMEPWIAFGLAVAAVLLLQARDRLHQLAQTLPGPEIITLGQFLILTGIVLPLLPNTPVTPLTPITPFQVWLAVVVVSSLSYGSYVLQKLLPGQRSVLATAVLGGMYSSTATTVVLAKRLRENAAAPGRHQAAIVLATALMYVRLLIVVAIFNMQIARELLTALLLLGLFGVALAALRLRAARHNATPVAVAAPPPSNPLELSAALIFAALFVITSIVSAWVIASFGDVGVYWLASIVGVSDIDPFVLSIAQGSASGMTPHTAAIAILIAASSNNLLKAIYSVSFGGWRCSIPIVVSLLALSLTGLVAAAWMMSHP
jgi:uncharacterized membrane protein (DUF4010 family)